MSFWLCHIIIVSFQILILALITALLVLSLMVYTSNSSILEISALPKINYSSFIVSYVIREPEFIAK